MVLFFCFVSHNQLCYDIHHNGTLLMGSINCENLNRLLQQPTKDSFITLYFFQPEIEIDLLSSL
jgi:hypothetical protein